MLQRSILFQQESRFVINYQFSPSSRNLSKTISKKWRFYIEGFVCYINDSSGSSVALLFFMVALIMPCCLSVILHDTKTCRTKANNNNNRCCLQPFLCCWFRFFVSIVARGKRFTNIYTPIFPQILDFLNISHINWDSTTTFSSYHYFQSSIFMKLN